MCEHNTVILLHGSESLTAREYHNFSKGDTIFGVDSSAEELKRWPISQKEDAQEELKRYKCEYDDRNDMVFVEEYALMYCEIDDSGEFISGADYDLAE